MFGIISLAALVAGIYLGYRFSDEMDPYIIKFVAWIKQFRK